ncbi:MAG: cell wall-binding repeat-containing protein [Coriobacteriia bacterium]|nr:cell wall-binding repeat-containing protein [Coriobacteriia bacterium]
MRVLRVMVVAALVLVFALGATLEADAMLIPMRVDELAEAADTIVVVKVAGARTRDHGTNPARPAIATDYRLQVSRVLKGSRPAEFSLTQPHGTIGDITLVVQDLPAFVPGEEALLFLDDQDRVIGGWQGKLAIERGVVGALGIGVDEVARRIESGRSLEAAAASASADLLGVSPTAVGGPVITAVSPTGANAGIGERVTIIGRDFGTVPGTVQFQRGDSLDVADVVQASVVSWSDTTVVVTVPQLAALFVRVTAASGVTSSDFPYQTGFSTNGRKWLSLPVSYRINENAAGVVGEGAAIQRALATWSDAGSWFTLAYAGSTTTAGTVQDYQNTISFSPLVSGALGINYYWIQGTTIIESDIVLSATEYTWGTYGASGVVDVETVVLHELGHTVGLDDQYRDVAEVMSAYRWTEHRTLSAADANGAVYLYGSDGEVAPPAPAVWSTSHPDAATWYSQRDVTWGWSSDVPVAGYRVVVDRVPDTLPSASAPFTTALTRLSPGLTDGLWYLHIRAETPTGLLGPVTHAVVRVDGTAPVGTMTVAGGQLIVSSPLVSIGSAVSDAYSGLAGLRISTDGGLTWGSWLSYASSRSVTLPDGDGLKSVHVQYLDRAGNVRTLTGSVMLESAPVVVAVLERWYGSDRYTTACEIAERAFSSADTVILATGQAFPDALSASGLAGAYDAPLLLTPGAYLPDQVAETITGLGAKKVIIVGGTGAVSEAVERTLRESLGLDVERIQGASRYETSAAIADHIMVKAGTPAGSTAFVVRGDAFADALAVSPIAYSQQMPVLLTQRDALPALTAEYLERYDVRQCIIIGGTGAISPDVAAAVGAITPVPAARWSGADRFTTAAEVASQACGLGWAQWSFVGVATGRSFPDALGGGVAAGKAGGILLMTQPESLSGPVAAALEARAADVRDCRVFGGVGAVSDAVYSDLGQALKD